MLSSANRAYNLAHSRLYKSQKLGYCVFQILPSSIKQNRSGGQKWILFRPPRYRSMLKFIQKVSTYFKFTSGFQFNTMSLSWQWHSFWEFPLTRKMFCYLQCDIGLCGRSRLLLFICAVFGNGFTFISYVTSGVTCGAETTYPSRTP
jgi:hypothetical protein